MKYDITEEEKEEQAKLRQEYIASVRASLVGQHEKKYIVFITYSHFFHPFLL